MAIVMSRSDTTLAQLVDQGLLDAVADGLLVCDSRGSIRAVNRRMEELAGYPSGDLIGQRVEMLVPQALRDQHIVHRERFAASGHPTRPMGTALYTSLVTKTGVTLPVDISLSALEVGTQRLTVAAVRDATYRVRQQLAMGAMSDVTEAILKGRAADEIHALVCQRAAELVDAEVALVAVREGQDEDFRVEAAAGEQTSGLVGSVLTDQFWTRAASSQGPLTIDGNFEHLRERLDRPLGPMVLFPLPEGQRRGFLLVAQDHGSPPFDDATLEILDTFASQAGLAFAYGRRLRALAVAGERDRIARDLHDLVIQRLFGAGLSLQVTSQIHAIHDADMEQRLNAVMESLDTAISELRRSIFDLEQQGGLGFRDRVLLSVEEALAGYNIQPTVKVDQEVVQPPEEATAHLLATLREALTNTGRHSQADRVDVSIAMGSDLVLVVRDNGVGLVESVTMGHGLSNMKSRAQQLGGDCEVFNSPEGGLELEWRVPI